MTRFVGLAGPDTVVWVNPQLVTSVGARDGKTWVCWGEHGVEVNLLPGEVVDLLEEALNDGVSP